jgi:hypothetical protein
VRGQPADAPTVSCRTETAKAQPSIAPKAPLAFLRRSRYHREKEA